MLKRFEVENFRGFRGRMVLDLSASSYEFNSQLVSGKPPVVRKALIYGENGVGKSALGIALFDISRHLTDNQKVRMRYLEPYRNLDSGSDVVSFRYVFSFIHDEDVIYEYVKSDPDTLVSEKLYFDGQRVFQWNHRHPSENMLSPDFARGLRTDMIGENVSPVRYVYGSVGSGKIVLLDKLMTFVGNMLWYRKLSYGNDYAGLVSGQSEIEDYIISNGRMDALAKFLSEHNIVYNLFPITIDGSKQLGVRFRKGEAYFDSVASTGTQALLLLFFWMERAQSLSFLFIDEFDAFYHYASARKVSEFLNEHSSFQSIATTHNTYLMQNDLTRPDCCYVMDRNRISPLNRRNSERELRYAHNLEKLYIGGAFDE